MSKRRPNGFWTTEKVDDSFDKLEKKLKRMPTSKNFNKLYRGALSAIQDGRYHPDISTWNGYLAHRNRDLHGWNPLKIDAVFDYLEHQLNRTPKNEEFMNAYGGALRAIKSGRYHPDISTWNGYLAHRKKGLNQNNWTPENIDDAFDKLEMQLNRAPICKEFKKVYHGALRAIIEKRYNSEIDSWTDYLKHRKKVGASSRVIWQDKESWNKHGISNGYDSRNAYTLVKSGDKNERSWYRKGEREGWLNEFPFSRTSARDKDNSLNILELILDEGGSE